MSSCHTLRFAQLSRGDTVTVLHTTSTSKDGRREIMQMSHLRRTRSFLVGTVLQWRRARFARTWTVIAQLSAQKKNVRARQRMYRVLYTFIRTCIYTYVRRSSTVSVCDVNRRHFLLFLIPLRLIRGRVIPSLLARLRSYRYYH